MLKNNDKNKRFRRCSSKKAQRIKIRRKENKEASNI